MMHALLQTWQNIAIGGGLIFAALVVMQKAFDRCTTPLDTGPHDYRLPMDRTRERERKDTIGKDVTDYDAVAVQQLKRLHDRRRGPNSDNGFRRRKSDQQGSVT
jgi:hypothetical protein